jgi:hypothetical protein
MFLDLIEVQMALSGLISKFILDTATNAFEIMCLPLNKGGKQILDVKSRNEAIDLWNLKEFLRVGDDRANFPPTSNWNRLPAANQSSRYSCWYFRGKNRASQTDFLALVTVVHIILALAR